MFNEDKNLSPYLSPLELSEKYDKLNEGGQHPDFTLSEWKFAVTNEDTRRGYWEWVAAAIEEWENDYNPAA